MCNQDTCVCLLWPPSVVIGNSLFITGCWKTTWTWIRRPEGSQTDERKSGLTKGIVMQTKSWRGFTQTKGIVMQTKLWRGFTQTKGIVMQTKSLWGFTQTKILSVVLDQGQQKGLRYKKGIYANRTDIHWKPNIGLIRYSSRKRKQKGILRENGQR